MFSRGKAEYFHGREKEQVFFKNALKKARSRGVGTSFLVQGSLGVGKTVCLKNVKKLFWKGIEVLPK